MDWILAVGSVALLAVGIIGKLRPDLLWRLYSLEPRWRRENPEQPANWYLRANKQGNYLIGVGFIFFVLAFVLA